jgi:hypothetical protein
VHYEWDFGDGATGEGPTPQHIYTAGGNYFVTLRVTDDDGRESACHTFADVTAVPVEPRTWGRIKALSRSGLLDPQRSFPTFPVQEPI